MSCKIQIENTDLRSIDCSRIVGVGDDDGSKSSEGFIGPNETGTGASSTMCFFFFFLEGAVMIGIYPWVALFSVPDKLHSSSKPTPDLAY